MNKLFVISLLVLTLIACKQNQSKETVAESPVITNAEKPKPDTASTVSATPSKATRTPGASGFSSAVDSISATPPNPDAKSTTGPGGKKYEAPKTNPRPSAHTCSPNFNTAAKSQGNHHFYYVTGFNPAEFACWLTIEKHAETICQNQPCIIDYVDSPQIKVSGGEADAATLKTHGIGRYKHDGSFWELNGANIWKRKPGYGYFNTNNHLGG